MSYSHLPVNRDARVIDLFCGIGGLTHGLILEGLNVVAGIDIDESCRHAFEKNNGAKFICKDVSKVTPRELESLFGSDCIKILVGCAPCQPFSTINPRRVVNRSSGEKWTALDSFLRLIMRVRPEIVSMENVAELANGRKFPIFDFFVATLKKNRYSVSFQVVDSARYGVPQRRKRLILLASQFGPISLITETLRGSPATVRESIEDLAPIQAGEICQSDPVHRASKLTELNKKRIKATPKNGGSAKHWDRRLLPSCFKREQGESYSASVYGRMKWDEPAPTMTTHCTTLGTGRFGHPTQNRAISLREAARLQTFPDYYEFQRPGEMNVSLLARHIGNAVPIRLGQIIAKSIECHLYRYSCGR